MAKLASFARSHIGRKCYSSHVDVIRKLQYSEYGNPMKVLSIVEESVDIGKLGNSLVGNEVLVRWLATPINPADINQVQGVYGIKSTLPAVGGNEGAGIVEQVASTVNSFKPGDHVVAFLQGGDDVEVGTWRSLHRVTADQIRTVPKQMPIEAAAMLKVNPPTAYRMLVDFATLNDKSLVLQNGATSAVGRAVIQLAKLKYGARTVNIFRDRKDAQSNKRTSDELMALGADMAITDTFFNKHSKDIIKNYGKANLGLNCVGGSLTLRMCQMLAPGASLITYGGMSLQPIQVSTTAFIFNDINLRGFWLSKWYSNRNNDKEAAHMLEELSQMIIDGDFKMNPYENVPLDKFSRAFDHTINQPGVPKQILRFDR